MKSKTSVWLRVIESLQELAKEEDRQFSLALAFSRKDKARLVIAKKAAVLELYGQDDDGDEGPLHIEVYLDAEVKLLAEFLAQEARLLQRAPLPRKKGTAP